eukprot:5973908-Prorocentrum_lima.AAC.1
MEALPEQDMIEISADATFAPGGEISRAGVVVKVYGVIVHWANVKQTLTPLSSCEAELVAAVTVVTLGLG